MKAQEKAVLAKLALVEADYQRAEGEDGGKDVFVHSRDEDGEGVYDHDYMPGV